MPAVTNLLSTILGTSVEKVIVVTGHNSEKMVDELEAFKSSQHNSEKIITVYNSNYKEGMFTSIKCGLENALSFRADTVPDAVLLFPVDSPLVSVDSIQKLIEVHSTHPNRFYAPCYRGKKGHPLLIPKAFYDEILNHDGEGGLKVITQRHDDKMVLVETEDEGVVIDMDTKDDYQYAINRRKQSNLNSIKNTAKKRKGKIILLRHGSTEQNREKIFLGQSDIPLSEDGKEEAHKAAIILSKMQMHNPIIWSSTLSRARETAIIISENTTKGIIACTYLDGFQEINLGSWDGKYISEIKTRFPEEYRKRGRDILRYKQGNSSENFYDLRYRVIRTLEEVLSKSDENQDIIIVSHAGPIRTIIAECNDISLEEAIKISIPKAIPLQIDGQLW